MQGSHEAEPAVAFDAAAATGALRDFAFAVQALQLYPPDSPVVATAVERAHGQLMPLLHSDQMSLTILPDTLRVGAEDVGVRSRTVRAVAEKLHQRGVAHVHLDAAVRISTLQSLAELLATDADTLKAAGGINEACERRQLPGLRLEMLQLERLFVSDGNGGDGPEAAIWEQVLGGYGDRAGLDEMDWGTLADDPEQLAGFLDWMLDEENPPAGVSEMSRIRAVQQLCERVGGAAEELGTDRVAAVAEVIGRFYDKLDKEVWIEVLGQPHDDASGFAAAGGEGAAGDAGRGSSTRHVAGAIASTLDRRQVEDLLVYALTSRREESPRIFGLFRNLLQERSERDVMERAIRDAVERQTEGDGERKTFAELWPRLSDALQGEDLSAYVSTSYQAQLEQLLAGGPLASPWDVERIDHRRRELEPVYLIQRKSKILLEVLASETDDDDYVTLVRELERALPELVVEGQYLSAEEILEALAGDLVPAKGRSDVQRAAARDVLIRFCNQHTLREVVRNLAGKDRTQLDAATRVFALLGAMAVPALLEALAQERSRSVRVHLMRMLSAIGEQALPELRKHLHDKRWFFVRNLVSIIGNVADADFAPHLAIIVNHPDVRVRREAVRSIAKLSPDAAARALVPALGDSDANVRLLAIRGLGTSGARAAVGPLRDLLRLGNFRGANTDVIRAAAIALGRIGSPEPVADLETLARPPWFFRRRRLAATEAAVWALATLRGQDSGDAPEARLEPEPEPDRNGGSPRREGGADSPSDTMPGR